MSTSKYSTAFFFYMHGKLQLQLTAGQLSQPNSPMNADLLLTLMPFTCAFNFFFSPSGAHTDPMADPQISKQLRALPIHFSALTGDVVLLLVLR